MTQDEQTDITEHNNSEQEGRFSRLLNKPISIRDPIHDDVSITKLEKEIIDNRLFQRLKRIKQLGPTHHVFIGATHTRFSHSIGSLYLAQKIIDSINKNYDMDLHKEYDDIPNKKITARDAFLTRLIALMHDMAHLPYGHTLEDEGSLLDEKQFLDSKRREIVFSEIFPIIEKHMDNANLNNAIDDLENDIDKLLIAIENGEPGIKSLKDHRYVADIVGNTICADLLDYVERDSKFAGLNINYSPRIISRFVLVNSQNDADKYRAGLVVEKSSNENAVPNTSLRTSDGKELKKSVMSDCIKLLRSRYNLAEKLHYNDSKIRFAGMIIRAVYCGIRAGIITEDELRTLAISGDDVLLEKLSQAGWESNGSTGKEINYNVKSARNLANGVINRETYTQVYKTDKTDHDDYTSIVERFKDPREREVLSRKLELVLNADPGSVFVYSPKKHTGKAEEAKMVTDDDVKSMRLLVENDNRLEHRKADMNSIRESFEYLWKMFVFLDQGYWKDWNQPDIKTLLDEDLLWEACHSFVVNEGDNSGLRKLRWYIRYLDPEQDKELVEIADLPHIEVPAKTTGPHEDWLEALDASIEKS